MKTPFSNFFKRVIHKKEMMPSQTIQKPIDVVNEEKKEIKIPEPKKDHSHAKTDKVRPFFTDQTLAKIRSKRKYRNRIQSENRKINRDK
jgi:hypothetical protein